MLKPVGVLLLLASPLAAQVTTLDSAGDVGSNASVAIGSDGLGLISYYDATNQAVRVAHCSNAACTAATITTLDSPVWAEQTAIAIGGDGLGLILYTAPGPPGTGTMRIAHCLDLPCSSAELWSVFDGFGNGEIVTGGDGRGLMSFVWQMSPAGAVSRIAHCLGDACSSVESPSGVSGLNQLAVGSDGLGLSVHVVRNVLDIFPNELMAVHCSDAACSAVTASSLLVSPVPGVVTLITGDLAVGADGRGLFLLDAPDGEWMARCADILCSSITRVPVIPGESLAFGPDGLAVMSHPGAALRLSHCDDADCSAQTFSTPIDVGAAGTSLRVGPDGLALVAYQGGSADLKVAHCSMTSCLVPGPKLSVSDAAVAEGDAGTSGAEVLVTLSEASAAPVTVDWQTHVGNGATATPGVDFIAANGTLTFAPGDLSRTVTVSVNGDTAAEPDEFLFLLLSGAAGAPVQHDLGRLTLVDDDAPSMSFDELVHGSVQRHDLQAGPGPVADLDYFRLGQQPYTSWEVIADGASGDVPPLLVERLAADGVTVLQTGTSATNGSSVSLRWSNDSGFPVLNQHIGVGSGGCGASCGSSAVYRIRAWETTGRIARLNNSASQVTVVILENSSSAPVTGTLWFFGATGTPLGSQPFGLGPRASYILDTRGIAAVAGASGSMTVTHDARYGDVAGKAVAVEPATGFTFDTPLTYRPR